MQKKLIALAIAGMAAAPAFAQSNVTIYGVADVYYGYGKTDDGKKFSGINSGGLSGSRLGFKGTEDLGNGLKALFVYEFGTTVDTGSLGTARQSYVGLGGNWGTVVAGRLQTPGYDFASKYDAFGAAIFSPVRQLGFNDGLTINATDNGRLPNAAAYISPSFGGVTLKAAYAFGEQVKTKAADGNVKDPSNVWALAADYDNGPLSIGAVWHDLNGANSRVSQTADQTEWALGASYDFSVVKLTGSYQQAKFKTSGLGLPSSSLKDKLWNIGVAVPVGAGAVKFAYGQMKVDGGAGSDGKARSWGVDYEHGLSKRTTAYVGYSQIRNKDLDGTNGFYYTNLNTGLIPSSTANDPRARQLGFGVRHVF